MHVNRSQTDQIFLQAIELDSQNQERQAIEIFKSLLESDLSPQNKPILLAFLGNSLREIGEYQESLSILEKAVSDYPDFFGLKIFLAMTLSKLGQHQKAMRYCLEIAALGEHKSVSYFKNSFKYYAYSFEV